jgi:hypothetical protein
MSELLPSSAWHPISDLPDSDDLFWFRRGDVVDGPRESCADDYDYWDFFASCEAPSFRKAGES